MRFTLRVRLGSAKTDQQGWLRTSCLLVIVLVTLWGTVSAGRGQSGNDVAAHPDAQVPTPQVVREPAGASRCEFCHRSEVEGYARSAMAHSLRRAGHEPDGEVDTPSTKITVYSSPTGYWQRLQRAGEEIGRAHV